jgi:hypothetical protein
MPRLRRQNLRARSRGVSCINMRLLTFSRCQHPGPAERADRITCPRQFRLSRAQRLSSPPVHHQTRTPASTWRSSNQNGSARCWLGFYPIGPLMSRRWYRQVETDGFTRDLPVPAVRSPPARPSTPNARDSTS